MIFHYFFRLIDAQSNARIGLIFLGVLFWDNLYSDRYLYIGSWVLTVGLAYLQLVYSWNFTVFDFILGTSIFVTCDSNMYLNDSPDLENLESTWTVKMTQRKPRKPGIHMRDKKSHLE